MNKKMAEEIRAQIKSLEEFNSADEFEIDRYNGEIRRRRSSIQRRVERIAQLCGELDDIEEVSK